MSKLRDEAFRLAFYVGIVDREILEAGNDTALGLLMKAYGIEGNPELELMKLLSRVSLHSLLKQFVILILAVSDKRLHP